jgi:hypothetical protein
LPANRTIGSVSPSHTLAAPSSADITINTISAPGIVLLTNQYVPNTSLPGGAIQVNGQRSSTSASIISPPSFSTNGAIINGAIIIDSRSSITTGNIDALRSSVAFSAVNNITTGKIDTATVSVNENNSVALTSSAGNIVVETIDAGSNGIDISAFGLFQATGSSREGFYAEYSIMPQPGTSLRNLLDSRGITNIANPGPPGTVNASFPVSIIARPSNQIQDLQVLRPLLYSMLRLLSDMERHRDL